MLDACPLCFADSSQHFFTDARRDYLRCTQCALIFVPKAFHLSSTDEKIQYDLHQNDPADARYRRFLSRLFNPLNEKLPAHSHGLDFGSGPGPTLSVMLAEAGHKTDIYDVYYANDPTVLAHDFDFITATEVVEHLSAPGKVLEMLWGRLNKEGWLGIMTRLVDSSEAFARWHYINDPTHIAFFSRETFLGLSRRWATPVEFVGNDVIIFGKK